MLSHAVKLQLKFIMGLRTGVPHAHRGGGSQASLLFFSSIVQNASTQCRKPAPRGMASQHGHVIESADESSNKVGPFLLLMSP